MRVRDHLNPWRCPGCRAKRSLLLLTRFMIPPTETAQKFAVSIPAPIRQRPHGGMQRHGLDVVTQRVRLSPRINHPFFGRLDVVARAVKAALDFRGGAALDFYRPMFAVRPGQQ
jgi:hypothetical protein